MSKQYCNLQNRLSTKEKNKLPVTEAVVIKNTEKEDIEVIKPNTGSEVAASDIKQIDTAIENEIPSQIDSKIIVESQNISEINEEEKSKHFFVEVMVTAGPRKNFSENAKEGDYGLGEDVAGAIVLREKVYFWVLDGTSDSPILKKSEGKEEYFSSRLLAQTLAWELQSLCNNNQKLKSFEIIQKAIANTQKEWKSKINDLPEKDKELLIQILKSYNSIMCSTTVIFGCLDIDGYMDVCRIGDSRIVTNPPHNQDERTGRVFALLINEGDYFQLSFNHFDDTKFQKIENKGVDTVIAMSDGISKLTEKWLNAIPKLNFSDINIRRSLAQTQQLTCDDKSMCIIQIRN